MQNNFDWNSLRRNLKNIDCRRAILFVEHFNWGGDDDDDVCKNRNAKSTNMHFAFLDLQLYWYVWDIRVKNRNCRNIGYECKVSSTINCNSCFKRMYEKRQHSLGSAFIYLLCGGRHPTDGGCPISLSSACNRTVSGKGGDSTDTVD